MLKAKDKDITCTHARSLAVCVFKPPKKNVKRKCVEFSFFRIGFNWMSDFSEGLVKAAFALASAVRAERQL